MSDLVRKLRHEAWHTGYKPSKPWDLLVEAADELERLTRELEEARKDQARYRWLRYASGEEWQQIMLTDPDGCDAAIDAAMSQDGRADDRIQPRR